MSHPRRDGDRTLTSEAKTWPTPQARSAPDCDAEANRNAPSLECTAIRQWQTPSARDQEGSGFRGGDRREEPKLGGQAKQWPTPAARDHKSGQASQETLDKNTRPLNEVALVCSHLAPTQTGEQSPLTSGRRLNPAFVSWLMGAPWWWTKAEPISFGAREMRSYRFALLSRLSILCEGLEY
jgi:hypothetical protein